MLYARLAGVALLLVALAAFTSAGEAKKATDPIEGSWKLVAVQVKGKDAPQEFIDEKEFIMSFHEGKYKVVAKDGTVEEEGTYSTDAKVKPAQLNSEILKGREKGKQVGIYKNEPGQLVLCIVPPGVERRPTEFVSTPENGQVILTLKKAAK